LGYGFRMKRLILASIFCVALAGRSHAQDKPQQLIPPEKLLEFPQFVNPSSGRPVHSLDLSKQPRVLELKGVPSAQSGVCSVPLLEAHADAIDPGIAFTPGNTAVPIPQARVPAPACEKK
jgi:hypothetical protein